MSSTAIPDSSGDVEVNSPPESLTSTVEVDRIKEDDALLPAEKETSLTFSKVDSVVHIHSDQAGVARRLVQHPEFVLTDYREKDGAVTDVRGVIPIGCLTIGMKPRQSGGHADIVTSSVLRTNDGLEEDGE